MSPNGPTTSPPQTSSASAVTREWEEAPLAQEVFLLNNLMMRVGDRLVAHRGLTASRWLLLGALEQYDEPPTQSELGQDALLSVQNVSRITTSMEEDGLVERFTVPGKGRSTFIRLTPAGEKLTADAKAECHVFREHFLAGLSSPEIEQTATVFQKLINNLEAFERTLKSKNNTPPAPIITHGDSA